MKKLFLTILTLLGLLLGCQVQAQSILAYTSFDCIPADYFGPGTKIHQEITEHGDWYEWACPMTQEDGGVIWKSQTFVVLANKRIKDYSIIDLLREVINSPNPLAAANAIQGRLSIPPTNAEGPIFDALHYQARLYGLANDPKPIPGGIWTVAVNGTYKTRQWYSYDPGKDLIYNKTSGAPVGTRCWPSVTWTSYITNGAVTYYMAYGTDPGAANPLRVTICTKQE